MTRREFLASVCCCVSFVVEFSSFATTCTLCPAPTDAFRLIVTFYNAAGRFGTGCHPDALPGLQKLVLAFVDRRHLGLLCLDSQTLALIHWLATWMHI